MPHFPICLRPRFSPGMLLSNEAPEKDLGRARNYEWDLGRVREGRSRGTRELISASRPEFARRTERERGLENDRERRKEDTILKCK